MATEERLTVTVAEAARLLGIGRGLAYELARLGILPVLRLGRRMVIPRAALAEMLAATGDKKPAPVVEDAVLKQSPAPGARGRRGAGGA